MADPGLLSEVIVVRELRDWLNLYSLDELPNKVLCLTILLFNDPIVLTVAAASPLAYMLFLSLDMFLDMSLDMFRLTTGMLAVTFLGVGGSLVTLSTWYSWAQKGKSLTVLLRDKE